MQHRRRVWTSPAILWTGGVTALTLGFGRFQNEGHLVGGDISAAKTLWLNLTLVTFLVLPAIWWRDRGLDRQMRFIFGFIFLSFAARAVIELPILYLTNWWHCSYGMAHDVATAAIGVLLYARRPRGRGYLETSVFLWFVVAVLLAEGGFAYAFCSVADPATGTYFASDEARFQMINVATWAAVAVGYPMLGALLWRYAEERRRRDGAW